jgi:hypothetical protein
MQRPAEVLDQPLNWQWKSTVLSSLDAVFHWLRLYRALPLERLGVFSASSQQGLQEQLALENLGEGSTSVTAVHFLRERRIQVPEETWAPTAGEGGADHERAAIAIASQPAVNENNREGNGLMERRRSVLESRRIALEAGPGGDHDEPYRFVLPAWMPQVLGWTKLLVRVSSGELEP